MTLFTIENLTRKEEECNGIRKNTKSPAKSQRKTLFDAMSLLSSSGGHPLAWEDACAGVSFQPSGPGVRVKDKGSALRGSNEILSTLDDSSSSISPAVSTSSSSSSPSSSSSSAEEPAIDHQKPPHSYIALIAMAILNSSAKRLLLCDIYDFIMERYPYFRNNERSWRNSIRHNLSLNECFVKAGRSDDGRGHFWAIHPANMEDFAKGDFRRRRARRRVRALTDLISYPYQYYPSHLPGHLGYVPMTYSPISTVFSSGVTPYVTPRIPPHPATIPSGYISTAVSNTVPSLSPPSPCVSTSAISSMGSPHSVNILSHSSCVPVVSSAPRLPNSQVSSARQCSIFSPYANEPWTAVSRTYQRFGQVHRPY